MSSSLVSEVREGVVEHAPTRRSPQAEPYKEYSHDTSTAPVPSNTAQGTSAESAALEQLKVQLAQVAGLSVDVIVDDTPQVVVLSHFDGRRREIARRALVELIAEGRIHPANIEDTVARHREAFQNELPDYGRALAVRAKVGALNDDILL